MPLNIKSAAVEALVDDIVGMTGESKTTAVLRALEARRDALALRRRHLDRAARLRRFLEEEAWPAIPAHARRPVTRQEREEILGYGPEGA